MTKRVLIAAGIITVLAWGSAIAVAQSQRPGLRGGPGFGGPGPRGGGPDLGLRSVQLSDEQREQVKTIMASHRAEFDQAAAKMREAHRAFAEASGAATVDEAAVKAASTAVAAAMADEAILRARVRTEVQGILTAEQLEQLKQRRAEMEKRLQERQQQGPPRPRRPGR